MMKHLGRSEGNPVLGVFQKYLTGHPKGAAGAWMLNGALQILQTGVVPGNRNADNVDKILEEFDYILYPSHSIKTDGVKAVSVTSFGFGQKGAQAIVINTDYLYAAMNKQDYESYKNRVAERSRKAHKFFHEGMINNTIFKSKEHAPYTDELEQKVYLDPSVRVTQITDASKSKLPIEGEGYVFAAKDVQKKVEAKETIKVLSNLVGDAKNVGVDVEFISNVPADNETFLERNYTAAEIEYCQAQPNIQASLAGTWSAKEAVFKSLQIAGNGAGASLKDIEITRESGKIPTVVLHGELAKIAESKGLTGIKVSISHDDLQAVAVAMTQ